MRDFGIYAWPAYSTKAGNPYNFLIYSNIEKEGCQVYEFDVSLRSILKSGFSSKYKILHLHWPSNILSASSYMNAKRRLLTFHIFLMILKLLKKKIVWTVHNLEAHGSQFPLLEKELNRLLYKYVDGFISLNKGGIGFIKKNAVNLNAQKFAYIPHPHYQGYYENRIDRDSARINLNIPIDSFVFLFLGQIRKYKNVTGLIDAFVNLNRTDAILLIAGNVHQEMKEELNEKIKGLDNIILYNSFVEDEDLQLFINASDLVVTPYTKIFNSGSVFLNLSFDKPTLAPDLWTFSELKQIFGNRWIKTYTGSISEEILYKAMLEVMSESFDSRKPDISSFKPELVATHTLDFYRSLLP